MEHGTFSLRPVTGADAGLLLQLVRQCPPLDEHTPYTYWVLARFFGRQSHILLRAGQPVGYITALDTPDGVFIWQIGILPAARGQGASQLLIGAVHKDAAARGLPMLTTIDDANTASRSAFAAYCRAHGLAMQPVDTLTLTDALHPDFCETERVYLIK